VKPTLDALVIYYIPSVRREREVRRALHSGRVALESASPQQPPQNTFGRRVAPRASAITSNNNTNTNG
jgi:hypothetical protein